VNPEKVRKIEELKKTLEPQEEAIFQKYGELIQKLDENSDLYKKMKDNFSNADEDRNIVRDILIKNKEYR
jgi:hypothetical protein